MDFLLSCSRGSRSYLSGVWQFSRGVVWCHALWRSGFLQMRTVGMCPVLIVFFVKVRDG
jgi:hypothetical protein